MRDVKQGIKTRFVKYVNSELAYTFAIFLLDKYVMSYYAMNCC
jgi:hypothetical protein